jgi:hypothetical protein
MITETQNQATGAATLLFDRGRELSSVRRCPSCGEVFSNKFGFCPVDGSPLTAKGGRPHVAPSPSACTKTDTSGGRGRWAESPAAEYRPTTLENKNLLLRLARQAYDALPGLRDAEHGRGGFLRLESAPPSKGQGRAASPRDATRDSFRLAVIEQKGLLRRLLAALGDAALTPFRAQQPARPSPSGAQVADKTAPAQGGGQRPEEPRFATLEGPGLLSRLAQELGAVAHDSRLTWPELRRDPSGFIRRAVGALDKLGLIPFSRRYKSTP